MQKIIFLTIICSVLHPVFGMDQDGSTRTLTSPRSSTAHAITDKNPVVLTLQSGKGVTRFTRTEVRELCNTLCLVPADNFTIIDGNAIPRSRGFQSLTTIEKEQLKQHALSWLIAVQDPTSEFKTFGDGSKVLVPTSCTLDLSCVAPLPAVCSRMIEKMSYERAPKETGKKQTILTCGPSELDAFGPITFLFNEAEFQTQLHALSTMPASGIELVGYKLTPEEQEQVRQCLLSYVAIFSRVSNDGKYLVIPPNWLTQLPILSPKLHLLKTTPLDQIEVINVPDDHEFTEDHKRALVLSLCATDDAVTLNESTPGKPPSLTIDASKTWFTVPGGSATSTEEEKEDDEEDGDDDNSEKDNTEELEDASQKEPNKYELLRNSPNNVTFTGFDRNNPMHVQIQNMLQKEVVCNALASVDSAVTVDSSDPENPAVTVDFSKLQLLRTEIRPTLMEKIFNKTTLTFGALCAVLTWYATKHHGTVE